MIGILCAMDDEAKMVIKKYNLEKVDETNFTKVYKNENIVLVIAGIGKIQASIGTMILLKYGKFEKIINIGIAGNTGKQATKAGDVFIVNEVYQHDMYLPFEGEHLNYAKKSIKIKDFSVNVEGVNIFEKAICATGDQFIDDREKIKQIVKKTNANVVEMEAFAFLSVLREFNLLNKAIIIKSVSDTADENAHLEHEFNLDLAMENGVKVLGKILSILS